MLRLTNQHYAHPSMSQDINLFDMVQKLEAQGKKNPANAFKWDDGSDHDDVSKIYVRGDPAGIRYIRFEYIKSGQQKYESFHGLTDQGFTQTFEINHKDDEQLVSVEGYYGSSEIQGLQFITNLRSSELIGYPEKGANKFTLAVEGKKIIGFHGSNSYIYLNTLGAYFTSIVPTRMEAKGGKGGKEWDGGDFYEGVTKIYVRGGCGGIQYIKFEYIRNGLRISLPAHGVRGRGFTELFEINHLENEYLVSVEGYYDDGDHGVIQGIQFKTNLKTSGLMGDDKGRKFSLAANGKKIVGFHGYADKNLNALGAYFTACPFIKLEAPGSTTVNLWDDGTFEGVRKVYVHYDKPYIYCVKFDYDNRGKQETREHGSLEKQVKEFVVDYPNEFITSVEGTKVDYSTMVVASLTFKTSKGRTATFGNVGCSKFVLESKGCGLVGFHGRSTSMLYALGEYFRPLPPLTHTEKIEAKGGDGGASWDDGGFDNIRNIYIGHSKMGITFVKFLYDKDNQIVVGEDHGRNTFLRVDEFEVKHPGEYLIAVEGSYDVLDGSESNVISMLRFKTNTRTSQLFGLETKPSFTLVKEHHKIVGFHGKIGKMRYQIGVHVLPLHNDYLHIKL